MTVLGYLLQQRGHTEKPGDQRRDSSFLLS